MKIYKISIAATLGVVMILGFGSCSDGKIENLPVAQNIYEVASDVKEEETETHIVQNASVNLEDAINDIVDEATKVISTVSELSDKATIIPLDTANLMRNVVKMLVNGDVAYMMDGQGLYGFDLNSGSQLFCYNKTGRNKMEYVKIVDFDIDSVNEKVYLLCEPGKIIELSLNLAFSRVIDIDGGYNRFAVEDGHIYLYSYYGHKLDMLYDDKVTCLMNLPETRSWIFGETRIFFKTTDGLMFTPEPFSSIYRVKDDNLEHIAHLSYPDENTTMNALKKKRQFGNERVRFVFPKIRNVMTTEDLMVVEYTYGINVRVCMIDKANHKVVSDDSKIAINPFPTLYYNHSLMVANELFLDASESVLDTVSVKFTYHPQPCKEGIQMAVFKYDYKR